MTEKGGVYFLKVDLSQTFLSVKRQTTQLSHRVELKGTHYDQGAP